MVFISASTGFLLQILVLTFTFGRDRNRMLSGRIFRRSAVVSAKLNPLWKFSLLGDAPRRLGPMVVVSNHCSHSDSFLISHVPWEMKWIGKSSLFRIPIVGWSMSLSGDIALKRGERSSIEDTMAACKAYLSRGVPVILFPEGTRSETDEMLPFKDGAFRLAVEAGVPVLPIAVDGTRMALPKHDWRFGGCTAMVTVGEPISTEGVDPENLEPLKMLARSRITDLRDTIRVPSFAMGMLNCTDRRRLRHEMELAGYQKPHNANPHNALSDAVEQAETLRWLLALGEERKQLKNA